MTFVLLQTFKPDQGPKAGQYIVFSVDTPQECDIINRCRSENALVRKYLRGAFISQAQKDIVFRADLQKKCQPGSTEQCS